jgi:hypothetical protein
MNVFDRLYQEVILEKIYGNTGWVYHRTKTNPESSDILKKGIVPGVNNSAMYGTGLYATYDLQDQLSSTMKRNYGEYILKGKINLDNFVILDKEIYDISGNKEDFKDYLKKFNVGLGEISQYTSDIAAEKWHNWKKRKYNGIIFTGRNDGRVAVIWNRRNFVPSSYSEDDGNTWKKLKSDISTIKKVRNVESDIDPQKENFLTPQMRKKIKKSIKKDDQIIGYDSNGNRIYEKNFNGEEKWWEYDSNKNVIYNKDSDGEEKWWEYEYDSRGNTTYIIDSDGAERWFEYDSNGNVNYSKDHKGNEMWFGYDSNGNVNYSKDHKGNEGKYDSEGNQIYLKDSITGDERWYDSEGRMTHFKDLKGNERWYDSEGRMTNFKDLKGNEKWYDLDGDEIPNTNLKTESFKTFFESMNPDNIDLNKAYDIFNKEYLESTGKSWSKDKFLGRARNWTFYGDENGYVAIRPQRSGFVKLVGAAGSDKSKFKGFKELISENSPVWGMVDDRIASLLTKLGFRGPNKIEMLIFNKLIKSDQFKDVLGGAEILNIEGSAVTLKYPDVGTVTKYFMGSPTYWSKLKTSIPLNKLNPFKSK